MSSFLRGGVKFENNEYGSGCWLSLNADNSNFTRTDGALACNGVCNRPFERE